MTINERHPAPWRIMARTKYQLVSYVTWSIIDSTDLIVLGDLDEQLAQRLCDLHNASVVQMRHPSWRVRLYPSSGKWYVAFRSPGIDTLLAREKTGYVHYHATPEAALLAADKWLKRKEAGNGRHPEK